MHGIPVRPGSGKKAQSTMNKTYQEAAQLRSCSCDFKGRWRPSAIMETMQEAGAAHSERLGVGRNALLNMDLAWILVRVQVEMDSYPRIGDTVVTETFPLNPRRGLFPRYYLFRDGSGAELGRAATLWALLNLSTRHMSNPPEILALMPDNSDLAAPLGLPGPVHEVSGTLETFDFRPVYTDLDMNLHVNNTRYLDWCCNALGVDTFRENCLRTFAVNYDQEVLPGQEVHSELRRLGDDFSYCSFVDGRRVFDLGGVLTPDPR